jgi:hypothetical protein
VPNNTYGYGRLDVFSAAFCPPPIVTAPSSVPPGSGGNSASVPSEAGHTYNWILTGGSIDSGQGTNQITFSSGAAGTKAVLLVTDSITGCLSQAASRTVPVDFLDVPLSHVFHDRIATIFRNGVTAGCGGGDYCPGSPVTRAQMAVFLLKAKHSAAYTPPAATGAVFPDVSSGAFAADWIEQLSAEGITFGCGGGNYCPDAAVTRAQMAVFLLRAKYGSSHLPPPATGVFADVPASDPFAKWIEQLAAEGITSGCGAGNYCPDDPNTRGQMAVFLAKTFELP